MNPNISAIIMAYNEENSLEMVVREINTALSKSDWSYEIFIIDDGSSDSTGIVADRLTKELSEIRVIHHKTNEGLGGVYRTGFSHARGDFITFFSADGQCPADIIKQFVPLMNDMDMVLGYLPNRNCSLLAKFLSKGERVLFKLLFGQLPKFQGVMMFKRSLLDGIELKSVGRGWVVVMELIIRAQRAGYKITSVPTELRPRISGKSKVINLPTIWANLSQAIVLRHNF